MNLPGLHDDVLAELEQWRGNASSPSRRTIHRSVCGVLARIPEQHRIEDGLTLACALPLIISNAAHACLICSRDIAQRAERYRLAGIRHNEALRFETDGVTDDDLDLLIALRRDDDGALQYAA